MKNLKLSALAAAILTALLSACGASTGAMPGGSPTPPSGGGAGTPVPTELQGEWRSGTASPIGYYDPSSGAWEGASGTSFILKLAPNGTYQFTGLLVVQSGTCESKILSVESGSVTLDSDSMTLNPSSGNVQYYICDPRNIKQGTLHNWKFTWKLGQDDSGKDALFLGDPSGQARPDAFYHPN